MRLLCRVTHFEAMCRMRFRYRMVWFVQNSLIFNKELNIVDA